MSINEVLDLFRRDPAFMKNVTAWEKLPAREAKYADFPAGLDPRIISALQTRGTAPLFTHQAAAVEAALAGENVVVVTGTASGKTLCYNLPVLQAALTDPEARALYLFPTKALAQDQASALAELLQTLDAVEQVPVRTYDGDTPPSGFTCWWPLRPATFWEPGCGEVVVSSIHRMRSLVVFPINVWAAPSCGFKAGCS